MTETQSMPRHLHELSAQAYDLVVVGDSHVYGDAETPFASAQTADLITGEFHQVLYLRHAKVVERRTGTYA